MAAKKREKPKGYERKNSLKPNGFAIPATGAGCKINMSASRAARSFGAASRSMA
jgi:hypothetical protein